MPNVLRRRILSGLLVLPFTGRLVKASVGEAAAAAGGVTSPEVALDAVRFFNTMESWHKLKFNSYAPHAQLLEWEVVRKILGRPAKEGGLRSKMSAGSENLLPGWSFSLHLAPRNDDYLITLRSSKLTLTSDGSGVIYHGETTADFGPPRSYAPLGTVLPSGFASLTSAGLSRRTARARAASVVKRVAFLNVSAAARTDCGCNCSSAPQGACWNSGTGGCPWCCCAYCSSCCYDAAAGSGGNGGGCINCSCPPILD